MTAEEREQVGVMERCGKIAAASLVAEPVTLG
jgi:hypothetical protein